MRNLILSRIWAVFAMAAATILYISGCSHTNLSPTAASTNAMVGAQAVTGDPQLNLEVWNPGDAPNFSRIAGRITNWGSSPIALNRITVKAWFNGLGEGVPQNYVGQSWANNQTLFSPGGGWMANVAQTSVVIKPSSGLVCNPNQVANWEVSISFTDSSSVQIPANGGYVQTNAPSSSLGAWNLSTWANFESPQDYSKISAAGTNSATRSNLQSYALYVDGNLVCEWLSPTVKDPNTGLRPCGISGCAVAPTATTTVEVDPTSTLTPEVDPTATVAVDPTGTATPVPPTSTATNTFTATATATNTHTNTSTATNTATATATNTATLTPTSTATSTFTATATATATSTNTATATATDPATATATATATAMPVTALSVDYMTFHPAGTTNNPSVLLEIHNDGNTQVNADQLEARYWFNDEGWSAPYATNVDWAGLLPPGAALTSQVSETIVPTSGHGSQDEYASYKFSTGGKMIPPGQFVEVQARFNKTDWSVKDQGADYSFAPDTAFTPTTKVTLYLNGALVSGVEP